MAFPPSAFGLDVSTSQCRPLGGAGIIAANDDCDDANIISLIGRPLLGDKDACIVVDLLSSGAYVIDVRDTNGASGNALVSATQVSFD